MYVECFSLVLLGSVKSFRKLINFFYILQKGARVGGYDDRFRISTGGWMGGYDDSLRIATGGWMGG